MAESKEKSLPSFGSTQELVDFFDEQDLGEYALPEVQFDVDIRQRQHFVTVNERLMGRLMRTAKMRQISVEELVDVLLSEQLTKAG
ncbi:MAG: CopG family antitoxin [Cyanobacteria bacterium P01_G01_bin.54]